MSFNSEGSQSNQTVRRSLNILLTQSVPDASHWNTQCSVALTHFFRVSKNKWFIWLASLSLLLTWSWTCGSTLLSRALNNFTCSTLYFTNEHMKGVGRNITSPLLKLHAKVPFFFYFVLHILFRFIFLFFLFCSCCSSSFCLLLLSLWLLLYSSFGPQQSELQYFAPDHSSHESSQLSAQTPSEEERAQKLP